MSLTSLVKRYDIETSPLIKRHRDQPNTNIYTKKQQKTYFITSIAHKNEDNGHPC